MHVLDAARLMARNYPGGAEAVAVRLGKSGSTLDKELRGAPGFKFCLRDADELGAMTFDVGGPHSLEVATALARRAGGTVLRLPTLPFADAVTAQSLAEMTREFADVVGACVAADSDNEVSHNELRNIHRQWAELVAAGQRLLQVMEAKHEATYARQGDAA